MPEEVKKPIRIQRKRAKDWKMPPNTVYVGRPTKWGNPFVLYHHFMNSHDPKAIAVRTREEAVAKFRARMEENISFRPDLWEHFSQELRGKNLACYCKPDQPCHADVLLELVNKKP